MSKSKTSNLKQQLIILHHWACSGGTLISKCVAAMRNVVFLSEINPDAYFRLADPSPTGYLPTDICQQLSLQHNGRDPVLCRSAFKGAIIGLSEKCHELKLQLVIRSHDHVDFFTGALPKEVFTSSDCFKDHFTLQELLTIRHPLDCWLALVDSRWMSQMNFASIDIFCSRCLIMLEAAKDFPVYKYESFILDPNSTMKEICDHLQLSFDPTFQSKFSEIMMSGNSGRQGSIISPRPRRPVSDELRKSLLESAHYQKACVSMGYDPNPDQSFPYLV